MAPKFLPGDDLTHNQKPLEYLEYEDKFLSQPDDAPVPNRIPKLFFERLEREESNRALTRILPHVLKEAGGQNTAVLERDKKIAKLEDEMRKYKKEQEKELKVLCDSNKRLKRERKELEWILTRITNNQSQTTSPSSTPDPHSKIRFASQLDHFKRTQEETLWIAKGLKVQIKINRGISFMKFDMKNAYTILKEAEEEADEVDFDLIQQNEEMRQLCRKKTMMDQELSRYWMHRWFWRQRDYRNTVVYGNSTLDCHEDIVNWDKQECLCDFYDMLVKLTKLAEERDH